MKNQARKLAVELSGASLRPWPGAWRRGRRPALAAATAAVLVAGLAAPAAAFGATADPTASAASVPAPFTSWEQLNAVQHRMDATAQALEDSPGQGDQQALAGVVVAPEDGHVTLYWHGALTSAAEAVIAHSSTPVVVKPASYTAAAADRASALVAQRIGSAGIAYDSISDPQDGSGLHLSVVGDDTQAARARQAIGSVDVPVTVTGGGQIGDVLADDSRANDPTAGGAAMVTPICSTAFNIDYHGRNAMLTAAHCFPDSNDNRSTIDHPDKPFGTLASPISSNNGGVDVAAIYPKTGTVFSPTLWRGGAQNSPASSQHKTTVVAAQKPKVGDWVCNDGARSGETCNIQIIEREDYYNGVGMKNQPTLYTKGWRAKSRGGYVARRGDSGGPVILGANNGTTSGTPSSQVTALGVVSASAGTGAYCGNTKCFKAFTFVGIDDALNALDDAEIWRYDTTSHREEPQSFAGVPSATGTLPVLDPTVDEEILDVNGNALGYDPTTKTYLGVPPGNPRGIWVPVPQPGGGWWFRNPASNVNLVPAGSGSFHLMPLVNGLVLIGHEGRCVQLVPGNPPKAYMGPCNAGDPTQRFVFAPVGDGLRSRCLSEHDRLVSAGQAWSACCRGIVGPTGWS
ncbi:hypothetical protein [Kitasatospora sp. MAP5-34]|uniref:hypothetical protein n=1 Tax=Kitasatospora sp. MAP5-34 TaxID=3035102 RepID=UPI0024758491|nr:hypothetical protein [Kitasatospora sp. MAP5-34]MDH6580295.1 hypothetical protein [Kitasatospora sp. MAP5-34]